MLHELSITNFAIIEHLRLRVDPHFNVFTGETGAGKSILVDALSALVGERVGADVVRTGAERALIEGVFAVEALLTRSEDSTPTEAAEPSEAPSFAALLAELGIEPEDGLLILAREVSRGGRTLARANGRTVPLSTLQRLTAPLLDIHGQSAHLTLLRPEQHVHYLDRYAGTVALRAQVAGLVRRWRTTRRELDRLRQSDRDAERRLELLRYQLEDIAAVQPRPGEQEELERERRLLANAERLGELAASVHAALSGDDALEARAAADALATAQRLLGELLRLDDSLRPQAETLDQAAFLLEDVVAGVRSFQDEVAADPARLAEVEERLAQVAKLRRKYGATVEEVLAFAADTAREVEELEHREERAAEVERAERALRVRIGEVAGQLSRRRRAAAQALATAMEAELDELNMRRARFSVHFAVQAEPEGAPVDWAGVASEAPLPAVCAFSATGVDTVEFLIAPNPGEPAKPLARIASGGETSRLMLALKTILSSADDVPILIFDEIDAGISGRSGQVVGEKLWRLGQAHQVLCVTHLPQIAALGDQHFRVAKDLHQDRTLTVVEALGKRERVDELSQMLGGARTPAARANAEELLARAAAWKRATGTPLPTP